MRENLRASKEATEKDKIFETLDSYPRKIKFGVQSPG